MSEIICAPTGNPDLNGNHSVDANELTFSAKLVGVTTANLTAHELGR